MHRPAPPFEARLRHRAAPCKRRKRAMEGRRRVCNHSALTRDHQQVISKGRTIMSAVHPADGCHAGADGQEADGVELEGRRGSRAGQAVGADHGRLEVEGENEERSSRGWRLPCPACKPWSWPSFFSLDQLVLKDSSASHRGLALAVSMEPQLCGACRTSRKADLAPQLIPHRKIGPGCQ